MGLRNTHTSYGSVARALHWLVAALLLLQFPLGFIGSDLPIGMDRLVTLARHKSLGMTVLLLVVLRLLWRQTNPVPALPAAMPAMERRLARAGHIGFYVLLLALPLVGWVSSSASNLTVSWFGWFVLPDLVGTDPALAKLAQACHAALAWLLLALIAMHVAAALRHRFVLRDDVLARMLPWGPGTGP